MSELISRNLGRAVVAVLILLWAMSAQTAQAGWSWSGIWEVEEDNAGDLLQTYQQTLSVAAGQDVTPIFSLEEYLRYGYYWKELDTGRETVAPGLTAVLSNALFTMDLSASALQTLGDATRLLDNEILELNMVSQWKREWWPNLSATAGQSNTYNTLEPNPSIDRSETRLNALLDWRLRKAVLYYSYRWNKFTDNISDREDTLDSHLATLNASDSFLDNRLHISFGQEFTQDTYVHDLSGGTTAGLVARTISRIRYGTDATPADLVDIADVDVLTLRDDTYPFAILPVVAVPDPVPPPANDYNIWLTLNGQQVDRIYIYTQSDISASLPVAGNWALYSNNSPGVTPWNTVIAPGSTIVSYDPLQQRYELLLPGPIQVSDLKVVFDNSSGTTMDITEIEALLNAVSGAGGMLLPDTELTTSRTRLNLDAALSKTLKFKYGFSMHNEEADQSYERESMTNNGALEFLSLDRTFRTVFSASDNRSEVQGQGEVANTSYGVEIGKDFLPTLHGSLNGSRTEYTSLGVDTLETDRYSFYLGAQLYPDLEASLELEYSLATNLLDGTETETTQLDWDLTSRLKPNINVSWTETFLMTETASTSEDTVTSALQLSWRPSDFLALNTGGRIDNLKTGPDTWRLNANMSMGIGISMLLDVDYQYYYDLVHVQVGRTALRWTISRYMFFQTGFDYIKRENQIDNNVKFFSELHVNFGRK